MSTVFSDFLTNFESDFWARCILWICCALATSCGIGEVAGRARPAPTEWWRVRFAIWAGCAGGMYARPYGFRLNRMYWQGCGPGMPGPYRGCERLCGNKGMAVGRDKFLLYCKRERLFLSLLLTFYGTYGRLLRRWVRRSGTCRAFSGYRRQRWTG